MINIEFVKIFCVCKTVESLYLVVVYGVMGDYFNMSSNSIEALGWSFLAQKMAKSE
ncbi:hypothetical protein ACFVHQ_11995 [Actinomycetes bacterium NPDC127524]